MISSRVPAMLADYVKRWGEPTPCICRELSGLCSECAAEPTRLTAAELAERRLDCEPWSGKIFPEIREALMREVLESIRDEQFVPVEVKALVSTCLLRLRQSKDAV